MTTNCCEARWYFQIDIALSGENCQFLVVFWVVGILPVIVQQTVPQAVQCSSEHTWTLLSVVLRLSPWQHSHSPGTSLTSHLNIGKLKHHSYSQQHLENINEGFISGDNFPRKKMFFLEDEYFNPSLNVIDARRRQFCVYFNVFQL